MASWEEIANRTQAQLRGKIPKASMLDDSLLSASIRNVSKIPEICGVLSAHEIEVTSVTDATTLLKKIHSGEWSAKAIMVAYCKHADIAHQLVNCLTDISFDNAIADAENLNEHFGESGNVAGPLHGLPISVKDHSGQQPDIVLFLIISRMKTPSYSEH